MSEFFNDNEKLNINETQNVFFETSSNGGESNLNEQYIKLREYEEYKNNRKFTRTPLILALFGLLCSLLFGGGIVFSIPSFILSLVRYSKKKTQTLRWAITLSVVGIALSLVFIATLVYAVISGLFAQTPIA